jgi:hypothetical protein
MADIQLRSYQSILGSMAARLMAETDLNDVSPGSIMLTILEAASASDFQLEAKLIQLLNLRNIDKASGIDLENLAFEMGVTPTRISATPSKVFVTVQESAFTKVFSNVYAGANSPVAGDDIIKIVNGSGFSASGAIYIGRGTRTSEAANYVSITNTGSYWEIQLAAPLTKDHLVGEEVVMAQGGKRTVNAGTVVFVEGIGLSPSIDFTIQQTSVLEDGEDRARGLLAIASLPGTSGRVGRKKISTFKSPPWSTAAVSNEQAANGGSDPETDSDLRQRIKDHVHNLAAGTERAIIRAVIGALDDEENKRVVSAYLRKPTNAGDPTILYIDDGTGFQPSFAGIGEEVIVPNAAGTESFFQLQKWPLVKAQVASVGTEPFALVGGESLYVEIDGTAEEMALPATAYRTPGVVTAQEIAESINANFRTIEARAKDGQLFISPVSYDPDYVRVGAATLGSDANTSLRFPVTKQYTIRLYKNDKLLQKNGGQAIVQSLKNSSWTGFISPATTGNPETLQFNVDGIDSPIITFTDIEFAANTSSQSIASATVADWVIMINKKFIGVTATALDDGTFTIKSNRGKTTQAKIAIIAGTLATKLFAANSLSVGTSPEYKINRLSGQIELAKTLSTGDVLKAGTVNTRGFVLTTAQASFDLSATNSHAAEMVMIADAPYTDVAVAQSGSIIFSAPSAGVMRLAGSTGQFSLVNANDVVHIWGTSLKNGLFRVLSIAANGSSIDIASPSGATGALALDGVNNRIRIFRTEGLPQLVTLPISSTVTTSSLAISIQSQVLGIDALALDTNEVRIQTSRFLGSGALGIPSVAGTARNLGIVEANYYSNDPHVASVESADLTGIPSQRLTISIDDSTAPYDSLSVNGSPFGFQNHNLPILTYLGANSGLLRQPQEKLDSSDLTLRTAFPSQTAGFGADTRATTVTGIELGQADNMVFLIDNDPARKTFDVPMYVDATVSGPSVPNSQEFDLIDSTGANLGSSTRWLGHRFQDYRIWFQAKATLPSSTPNTAIKLVSNSYGPNGEKIKATVSYPTQASTAASAEFTVEPSTDEILLKVFLASGNARPINLQPGRRVEVDPSGNQITYTFLPPVDLSSVLVGDIVNLQDSQFSAANRGPVSIDSVSNLVDLGNAFEHPVESASADVSGAINLHLAAAPSELIQIGDKVKIGSVERLVTAITDQTNFVVAAPGFTDGAAESATITHKLIKAANVPGFLAQAGDIVVVGLSVMRISSVISSSKFNVEQPYQYTGLQSGTLSRIQLKGQKYVIGSAQAFPTQTSQSLTVYQLNASKNTSADLQTAINGTAGVKDLVTASNATGSTGLGVFVKSTQDEIATGSEYTQLSNGENFIYDSTNASPSVRLKQATTSALEVGEKVRLVPATPQNIKDHFSKKQITGLTIAAEVSMVDRGRRIQVSSRTPGGSGQVFAVGGRASGQNVLSVRNNVQEISSQRAQIEMDRSAIDLLMPGNTIKISQPGRAKKKFTGTQPSSSTTVSIQEPSSGVASLTMSIPLVTIFAYTQSGTPVWAVRNIGRNRIRFEKMSGSATIPSLLNNDDWVLIGNGASYAGITTDTAFAPANQGWFQIRETDNSTYFDVDGQGVEQFVKTSAQSFIFTSYHSARPGDQVSLGFDSPLSTANKGTYTITSVPSTTTVLYANKNIFVEGPIALGTATSSIAVLDQGYISYRKVVMVAPKPSDPTNRSVLVVSPGYDLGLINEGQKAKINLPNRLSFGTDPVPGVNGYNYWTGLLRKVSRIVSGYQPDSVTYPGTAAAGVDIDPRPPQVNRVAVSLKVKTARGVSLQSISDTIKASIDSSINSLGLGEDVILSEIVKLVQEVPGVDSCVLTYPLPATERITIGDNAIAKISTNDITLS